ncbi:MAG TPA: FAD-dependent oxidoreductase [Stellaceae bacterium]|nr:FAD-dependent oxidoreductase [Stellaceae bacterium]
MPADPLLQPLRIKHLVLKNRVMSTSHAISYHDDFKPKQQYQLYHEEKAKGGIALTMFGGSTNVAPDSASVFGQLHAGYDDIIPYFQEFAARIHRHGAALMCQLSHLGGRTHWRADHWLPVVAPSRYREPMHRAVSKEMDRYDIERIVKSFGQAARRCKEGGLDGVEILAHGHLIGQFWSPAVNKRTDAFGGSLENRCRFGLMVLEEVRRQVGDGFIVGLRTTMGEGFAEGLSDEACLEIAVLHERSGLIDFLNLNYGRIDTVYGLASYMPGMQVGLAPNLRRAGAFKKHLSLPVFHACRITDMATARHAVGDGLVDMIGMTRAHIADPHIVNKLTRGEEERIRPCVGATYCSWHRRCIHNPAIGREAQLPHVVAPAAAKKRVVVIGAGPAGLEAARVSAERGHEVIVFEAAAKAGGQVRLAARVPSRKDLIGIIDWRVAEAERLGVAFRFNALADAEMVLAEAPDIVVAATGGLPDRLGEIAGSELCSTVWDVLEAPSRPTGHVLIFDGTGTINAASCAERLMLDGARITFVTPDHFATQETSHLDRPFLLRRLYQGKATIVPDRRLVGVARTGNSLAATLVNELTGEVETLSCESVVVENGTSPVTDAFDGLRRHSRNDGVTDIDALAAGAPQAVTVNPEGRFRLYRIGDAIASRDIHAAILDALRLCKDF